jgi:hypothetical protein
VDVEQVDELDQKPPKAKTIRGGRRVDYGFRDSKWLGGIIFMGRIKRRGSRRSTDVPDLILSSQAKAGCILG